MHHIAGTIGSMDVSVVVTAIATSARLRTFVESLERVYPDLPIYVGAQGQLEPRADDIAAKANVHWFELPFDCGISKARNFLVGKIQTEFILLCDDDLVFRSDFTLESSFSLFEKFADLGVIGGRLINFNYDTNGQVKSASKPEWEALHLIHDRDAKVLILVPASKLNAQCHEHAGQEVLFCDCVSNFSIIRRSLVFDRGAEWDERYRIEGEHLDFFLSLRSILGCRVAYYSGLFAEHHRIHGEVYARLRSRSTRGQAMQFEKLGIEWRIRIPDRIIRFRNGTITKHPFDRLHEVLSEAPKALKAVEQALAQFVPTHEMTHS